jgi:hypothetical protein
LWEGTLQLLRDQNRGALALVLAKLRRHKLAGSAPVFERIEGRQTARERITLAAGLTDPEPTDGILKALTSYARDRRPVSLRGTRPHRVLRHSLVVMAYYGARWKLQQEPQSRGLRGDSLEVKAAELVAQRYRLPAVSPVDSIKRARAALHPVMKQWILSLSKRDGNLLWGLAMDDAVHLPPTPSPRRRGALRP